MDWYLVIPRMDLVESPNNSFGTGTALLAAGGEVDPVFTNYGGNTVGITPF